MSEIVSYYLETGVDGSFVDIIAYIQTQYSGDDIFVEHSLINNGSITQVVDGAAPGDIVVSLRAAGISINEYTTYTDIKVTAVNESYGTDIAYASCDKTGLNSPSDAQQILESTTTTELSLSWNCNSTITGNSHVFYLDTENSPVEFSESNNPNGIQSPAKFSNLTADTKYSIVLQNQTVSGPGSNMSSPVDMWTMPPANTDVSVVQGESLTGNAIVTWNNSTSTKSYITKSNDNVKWSQLNSSLGSTSPFEDDGKLFPFVDGTTYYYKTQAISAKGGIYTNLNDETAVTLDYKELSPPASSRLKMIIASSSIIDW